MEQVYFYNPSGVSLFSVYVSDESYRYKEIMSDNKLYLEFELDYYIDIPSGSYVDYSGERYFAWDSAVITKINTKNFSYKLEMNTYQQLLSWNIFRFFTWDINGIIDQKTIKTEGSYSGTLTDIANLIVRNMNDVDSNWVVGTVISSESKLISFNNEKIIDFLINVCSEENFNTEFEVKSYYDINQGKRFKQLNIGKVTYSENSPIALSYGQGNGIISGIERSNGDSTKLKRLHFQGGDRNIDPSKYGQSTLHLPKSAPYEYNGVMYMTDPEGKYVQRQFNTTKYPSDSYSNEDIYPSRVGTVTSVITIDDSKGLYNIVDTNIPSDLNYNDYFISGETPTIIFQSGVLGGQEFDISNYNHTTKTFEIVPKEDGGVTIPKGTLIPSVGNSYEIFRISLPQSYIDTAEYNALIDAVKTLAKNEADNYNFKLYLDEIYAKNNWLNIGSKLNIGYWVNFSDPQFQTSTVKIRINSVKSYINNEYKFELGLTNTASASTVKNELLNINRNKVKIKDSKYNSIEYAKRRWADAIRLNQSLYDPTGDFYTEMIKPLSVQTLQALIGDESLQFEFVTSDFSTTIEPLFLYNKSGVNSGKVTIYSCSLRHLTLGISTIPTSRTITDYKHWNIPSYVSATLDSNKSYYVYVKCSKLGALNGNNVWVGTSAEFILSEVPIKLEDVANYYHLWYGFLSAEYDLDRSFRTMYGYTEILPGQVTANKYISSDGNCFIDFPNNAFKFASQGGSSGIDYNVTNPNQLTVKGTIIQSPSGSFFPIACFRGAFVYGVNYYKGDEVTYNGSSYVCTVNNVNIYPTDNGYWAISASKGADGINGINGADGINGTDAVTVQITGINIFKYPKNSTTPENASVTLTMNVQGITPTNYNWQYWNGSVWTNFGFYGQSATISAATWMNGLNILKIKGSINDGAYYDEYTLYKLYDGTDTLNVILSNESHTVACGSDGTPKSGEIAKANTDVHVYRGSTELSFLQDWDIDEFTSDGASFGRASLQSKNIYLSSFYTNSNSGYCDIVVVVGSVYITKRFTVAKSIDGLTGNTGDYFEYRYAKNGSNIKPPSIIVTDTIPSGWSLTLPSATLTEYIWYTVAKKTYSGALLINWSTPQRLTGNKGDSGAALTYKGNWDNTKEYYGSSLVVQVVYYSVKSQYYISRSDAGIIPVGTSPENTTYWNVFGASFESVATGLLLAQSAYIENLIVSQLSTSANPYSARLANIGTGIGIFKNLEDSSSIDNSIIAMGKDISSMQSTGERKPAIKIRDKQWRGNYNSTYIYYKDDRVYYNGSTYIFVKEWSESETPSSGHTPPSYYDDYWHYIGSGNLGGGSYSEFGCEGIFANGGNITGFSGVTGIAGNSSGVFLLQRKTTTTSDISSAIIGMDQTYETYTVWVSGTSYVAGDKVFYNSKFYKCIVATSSALPTNTVYWKEFTFSNTYGGWFNTAYIGSLRKSCRRVSTSQTLLKTDSIIHCYNTSTIVLKLPVPNDSMIGMEIRIRVLGTNTVTISTDNPFLIWYSAATANYNINNDNSMMLTWDGNYWVTCFMQEA